MPAPVPAGVVPEAALSCISWPAPAKAGAGAGLPCAHQQVSALNSTQCLECLSSLTHFIAALLSLGLMSTPQLAEPGFCSARCSVPQGSPVPPCFLQPDVHPTLNAGRCRTISACWAGQTCPGPTSVRGGAGSSNISSSSSSKQASLLPCNFFCVKPLKETSLACCCPRSCQLLVLPTSNCL